MGSFYNRKSLVSLVAALLFLSNIFLFSPIVIYQGNPTGFNFYLPVILLILLIPFFLLLFMLTLTGSLLPEQKHKLFVVILSSMGILLWIQGTFLVWNLGVLDGSLINWRTVRWKGFVDGAVWILFLGMAIAIYKRFYRISLPAGVLILVSQVIMVCVLTYKTPEMWYRKLTISDAPPKEVFQFSDKQNVLHIVLDQFGTELFEKIVKENKSYADALDGFTFFREVTTSSHVTFISVPSFLSGNIYTNNVDVTEFYQENYKKRNIQTELAQNGYDLDIITQPGFLERRNTDTYYYNIPTPYSTNTTGQMSVYRAAFLFDLSLFRNVPLYLKKMIYNDQSWMLSSLALPEKDSKFEHFSANEFLEDLTTNASIERTKPVYKYIHLMTPHPPLVVNSNHKFAGRVLHEVSPVFFNYQAEFTFNNVIKLLEQLKHLDLYNSTFIIIQSDHGSGIPFDLFFPEGDKSSSYGTFIQSDIFLPLLLIKKPNEHGVLKTSNAQGELTDIPATISSVLKIQNNFPGQSLFDMDSLSDRRRTAYYSTVTNRNDAMISGFFDDYQEFIITGSLYKFDSWKKGGIMKKPSPPYTWGTVLSFIDNGNVTSYLNEGWGPPVESCTWGSGKIASLKIPINLPRTEQIELSCFISPFLVPAKGLNKQNLTISINNSVVGEFVISSPGVQKVSLLFSRKLIANSSEMLVSFSMPDATIGSDVGIQGEGRMLGVAFYSITFSEHRE